MKNERYLLHGITASQNTNKTCGAKTRSGSPCRNHPVAGKKRCRMHGGASVEGENHWNYKHGFHTKKARKERAEMMRLLKKHIRMLKDEISL